MDLVIKEACDNYKNYLELILKPSASDFLDSLENNSISLHEAFGANLFVAHAVDYIHEIRKATKVNQGRAAFIREFDKLYGVAGSHFSGRKFELIDAINNSLKHVKLDEKRYKDIVNQYGSISFKCLIPDGGRVLCFLDGYRFDYARSILRPAIRALTEWRLDSVDEVLGFAHGDNLVKESIGLPEESYLSYEWEDPIEQMIEYCNPKCADCEESASDCMCATYVFAGEQGSFEPCFNPNFRFDDVMSRISGAYKPGR